MILDSSRHLLAENYLRASDARAMPVRSTRSDIGFAGATLNNGALAACLRAVTPDEVRAKVCGRLKFAMKHSLNGKSLWRPAG
ncbi:hypothetical protein [Paraburkholderia phenoliruptrix]|uniref:hypothetical protein n=1 Tax=Paraburkholderia phenoliruptrix TaxID=252970 RepID=UPI0034CD640F